MSSRRKTSSFNQLKKRLGPQLSPANAARVAAFIARKYRPITEENVWIESFGPSKTNWGDDLLDTIVQVEPDDGYDWRLQNTWWLQAALRRFRKLRLSKNRAKVGVLGFGFSVPRQQDWIWWRERWIEPVAQW